MATESQLWFNFSYRARAVHRNDVSIGARKMSTKKLRTLTKQGQWHRFARP